MTPILFSSSSSSFATRGIGTLVDALSCVATEERNGEYELEMTYPVTGHNFENLAVQNIILAKPNTYDDPQPFRIYKITKPLNGICTICARHISYDLTGVIVASGLSATSAGAALSAMASNCSGIGNFTFTSDNATTASWSTSKPYTFRQLMGGVEGSILDRFGGEYHYDVWNVANMANRGADRGFVVRYGKNLVDINQEEECANCYTGVKAYWYKDGVLVESQIQSTGISLGYDRNLLLDASEEFENAPDDLDEWVLEYIDKHELSSPKVSIKLSFQQIDEDYLERITLCDTVSVYFEMLGVSAKAKVIRTTYDTLLERYESIEIGSIRSNLADTIVSVEKEVAERPTVSNMQSAIDSATALLTGARGGYVVINRDANGTPMELLIMDSPDITTAQKIWRWNMNGLGYSNDYGHSYGLAMTSDGSIVADYIKTGILQSGDGESFYLNLGTGELRMKAADIFLGNQDLAETINQVNDNSAGIAQIGNYLAYDSDTGIVTLGDSNSEIALKVENDRVAFVDVANGDAELAYFTNQRLMITDATIINSLDFGNYRLDTQYNGITFRWVG